MTAKTENGSPNHNNGLSSGTYNWLKTLGHWEIKWWVAILNLVFAAIFFVLGMLLPGGRILDWPRPAAFTVLVLLFLLFAFLKGPSKSPHCRYPSQCLCCSYIYQ